MEENNFTSESINEIAAALSQFQGAVAQPTFNKSVNYGQTRFRYADLAECQRVTRKPLADAGLSVSQLIVGNKLITMVMHKSGQYLRSELPIVLPNKMQDIGSMLTYLKRYSYCAILGIAADDDDDANLYDKTGKAVEIIERPSPMPKPTDNKATKVAKPDDKIADALMSKTHEKDVQEAIALALGATSIDILQGLWDSVTDVMRADKRFINAVKQAKERLKNGTSN